MKEPKLLKKVKNIDLKKQKIILVIVILFVLVLFIGSTYSLLKKYDETEEVITFQTGELKMQVSDINDDLHLKGELPKSDTEGFQNQEVKITLTNIGTLEIGKYEVKLLDETNTSNLDETNSSILDDEYIRYSISEDDNKRYLKSDILTTNNNIIYTGYNLKVGEIKTIYLKVWLDEKSGEAILSKNYNGKIKVELYQRGNRDENLVNVVKSKLVSNYSGVQEDFSGGLVAVNTNGDLYNETKSEEIREYRYSGPNVNNYVTFNNETWRIIGVFKDEEGQEHVKIVRNEALDAIFPETYKIGDITYNIKISNNTAYWNKKVEGTINNDWATAGLQYFLNTEKDDNNNKGYLSYVNENSLNMIEINKYYLGAVTTNSSPVIKVIDSPKQAYFNERIVSGCKENKGPTENNNQTALEKNETCRVWANNFSILEDKVGFLYPSDYGYSFLSNNWSNSMDTFSNENVKVTSWMNITMSSLGWFLTPTTFTRDSVTVWTIGYVDNRGVNYYQGALVRPVLYLKSNVKITSGDGRSDNAYKLVI